MDEGTFVLNTPTFAMMDLEADISSPDELLYYLTDQGQQNLPDLPFDSSVGNVLFDNFTSVPTLSSSASNSSSSSPASSPPSSFSFSASPSECSPVSSPSASCSESSPGGPHIDLEDHFVFGSWIESALDSTEAASGTISPAQLQMGGVSLDVLPQILAPTPAPVEDEENPAGKNKKSGVKKESTRKRKRTRKSSDEAVQTAVTLPREELLKLSSQELEEYAENLRKVRKLTAEEEKDLRRQRRLIKNRESAQLSRVRKREHLEVLEQQLQEVQAENERLKQQVESLTAENLQLKQTIASSSSPSLSLSAVAPPRSPQLASSDTSSDETPQSFIKMVQGWTTLGKGATATAVKATYLFVILLSIGLFFNARFMHYGPSLGPLEMGAHRPHVFQLPPSSQSSDLSNSAYAQSVNAFDDSPYRRGGRSLLELRESIDNKPHRNAQHEEISLGKIIDAKSWVKETPSSPFLHPEVAHSSTTMAAGEAANKTILMCPAVTPLQWPGQEMSSNSEEITFILPASTAAYIPASRMHNDYSSSSSSSFSATARHASGSMVQLTCKIVDARMTSLGSAFVQ